MGLNIKKGLQLIVLKTMKKGNERQSFKHKERNVPNTQVSNESEDDSSTDRLLPHAYGPQVQVALKIDRWGSPSMLGINYWDLALTNMGRPKKGLYEEPRLVATGMTKMPGFERFLNKYMFQWMSEKLNRYNLKLFWEFILYIKPC